MIHSLGIDSELMIMNGVSQIEEHADRIVLRTPSEPNYWYGNMVFFRSPRVEPEKQISLFSSDFPDARHVTLAWDAPNMVRGPEHEALVKMGFEMDETDVLTLTGPLKPLAVPEHFTFRAVESGADWEQVVLLQTETGEEQGNRGEAFLSFMRQRFNSRRRQIAEGWGVWFGAFDGDLLVGDLGIFVNDRTARFQSVETRRSHRGKGICTTLISNAVSWAAKVRPTAVPLIVAGKDSAAGRLYRRCGFTQTETMISALKRP